MGIGITPIWSSVPLLTDGLSAAPATNVPVVLHKVHHPPRQAAFMQRASTFTIRRIEDEKCHFFRFAILLIVLGTAWTLYLEYDKKRFIDSLPQPPATVTQPVSTADAPATSTSIVTTAAEPAPPETVVEDTLTESEQAHPHPHTDSLEPTEEAGRFDDDMFSDSEIPSDLVDLPLPQTKEPRRHWKELWKEE